MYREIIKPSLTCNFWSSYLSLVKKYATQNIFRLLHMLCMKVVVAVQGNYKFREESWVVRLYLSFLNQWRATLKVRLNKRVEREREREDGISKWSGKKYKVIEKEIFSRFFYFRFASLVADASSNFVVVVVTYFVFFSVLSGSFVSSFVS